MRPVFPQQIHFHSVKEDGTTKEEANKDVLLIILLYEVHNIEVR